MLTLKDVQQALGTNITGCHHALLPSYVFSSIIPVYQQYTLSKPLHQPLVPQCNHPSQLFCRSLQELLENSNSSTSCTPCLCSFDATLCKYQKTESLRRQQQPSGTFSKLLTVVAYRREALPHHGRYRNIFVPPNEKKLGTK